MTRRYDLSNGCPDCGNMDDFWRAKKTIMNEWFSIEKGEFPQFVKEGEEPEPEHKTQPITCGKCKRKFPGDTVRWEEGTFS